eukprot:TRINITY_DN1487_c0_g2_i5.p3 TRINITY_DN1487_c0_g2~~TRINITY_DN1487_c0_g2_i5.p3  ORF type:complete len:244 (-),score=55.58 TRINITY_DN1487_c0_g2_i5:972-1703(-)
MSNNVLSNNKKMMNGNGVADKIESKSVGLNQQLYDYVLNYTREPEVLARLRSHTKQLLGAERSKLQIAPEQAPFLSMLVKASGSKKAIEVGVFTGYSSIAIGSALPTDGTLTAIDIDEQTMAVAKKYWQEAGLDSKIKSKLGNATEILNDLLQQEGEGSYDFAFVDADKPSYEGYFEQLLKLVKTGGLIVVDNVLWNGYVVDPEKNDDNTEAIRKFNEKIFQDKRIDLSFLPVSDGISICRKL